MKMYTVVVDGLYVSNRSNYYLIGLTDVIIEARFSSLAECEEFQRSHIIDGNIKGNSYIAEIDFSIKPVKSSIKNVTITELEEKFEEWMKSGHPQATEKNMDDFDDSRQWWLENTPDGILLSSLTVY